jgi:hypothetical protein
MKKSKKTVQGFSVSKSTRSFRPGVLFAVLLVIGTVTVIAKYKSRNDDSKASAKQAQIANQPGSPYVTVDVGGKKRLVNAQTLQQGPLTQDQAQQIAAALKDNQSTDGLAQVQQADGSVSIDLQGRFQNVILAKTNSVGSLDQSCVDNPESASAFLQSKETTKQSEAGQGRKAVFKEQ